MEEPGTQQFRTSQAAQPPADQARQPASVSENAMQPIGVVIEIAGSGSQIALDPQRINECAEDADPSIALAGQVGSQVKIRVGSAWLLGVAVFSKPRRMAARPSSNVASVSGQVAPR